MPHGLIGSTKRKKCERGIIQRAEVNGLQRKDAKLIIIDRILEGQKVKVFIDPIAIENFIYGSIAMNLGLTLEKDTNEEVKLLNG